MPALQARSGSEAAFVLESDELRVVLDPAAGGKIRSVYSKPACCELFYQDPRREFSSSGYSQHDMSGFDECFPTVWACTVPKGEYTGLELPDHGFLWSEPWDCSVINNSATMSRLVSQINCKFVRQCELRANRLSSHYEVSNRVSSAIPFIYSAHPLLAVNEHSRLLLPREIERLFVFCLLGSETPITTKWFDRGDVATLFDSPYRAERHSVAKIYTPELRNRQAVLQHSDKNLQLRMTFGGEPLKHMGILLYQGYDDRPGGNFWHESFVALEPTTSIGDDLSTAIETGTLQELKGGQTLHFWIQLEVEVLGHAIDDVYDFGVR